MNKLFETLLKNTSKEFISNSNTLMIKFYYKVFPIHKIMLEREDNLNALREATAKENNLRAEDVRINYIFGEEREVNSFAVSFENRDTPW